MGFLNFKRHNLLLAKMLAIRRDEIESEEDQQNLGAMVSESLCSAWRLLKDDIGCPKELIEAVQMCMKFAR
jgi:hypothetical protein